MKPATINRRAFDMIHHPKISAIIEQEKDRLRRVVTIDKERILYEIEAIIDAKITDYFEIINGERVLKDLSKLSEKQARGIESIKKTKDGYEIKVHGKSWSTDRANKMLGYETPKQIDHTTKGEKIEKADTILILPPNSREDGGS
jgi:hypothetical protein